MNERVFDVTVVVRECGERTAGACAELLQALFPDQQIHRVSGRPFSATLRRSLEKGLQEGRTWLLCIDADVLVLTELINFVTEMSRLPDDVFVGQALVVDKFLPTRRPAGNHLYRTAFIPAALSFIQDGSVLRPETEMITAMRAKGFSFHQSRRIIGLHDFEQYFVDVYLKAYLHSKKHANLMHLTEPVWQYLARDDVDFQLALIALGDARLDESPPEVSRDFRLDAAEHALASLAIPEKPPLEPGLDAFRSSLSSGAVDHAYLVHERNLAELQVLIDKYVFPDDPHGGASAKDRLRAWARRRLRFLTSG